MRTPAPLPFFLALVGPPGPVSKQAGEEGRGEPEKPLQYWDDPAAHPGELCSVVTFVHLSSVLHRVVFTSNCDLTVQMLGIVLIFIPTSNPSKMKELVFA